jgi:hypothetical protein
VLRFLQWHICMQNLEKSVSWFNLNVERKLQKSQNPNCDLITSIFNFRRKDGYEWVVRMLLFRSSVMGVMSVLWRVIELFHLPTLMHNSLFINNTYSYTTIHDMFRALTCPSSGGPIVFSQHLVTSRSVNGINMSALNRCTVQPFTESDVTRCCENTIGPPEDGHVNARNMSRIVV